MGTWIKRRMSALKGTSGLAAMAADISSKGPTWYDPWSNEVTPEFAETLAGIAKLLANTTAILAPLADRLAAIRISEEILGEGLQRQGLSIASFDFDALESEARKWEGDPLTRTDAAFNARLAALKTRELTELARGYRTCERLAALCAFDYSGFLALFSKKSGAFKPIAATAVLERLDDLRYLLQDFSPDASTALVLDLLANLKPAGELVQKSNLDAIQKLATLMSGPLTPVRISAVMTTARMEPADTVRVWKDSEDIRKLFAERMVAEYQEKRRTYLEKRSQAQFEERKQALFGSNPLPEVVGFTEDRNTLFSEHNLPLFKHMLALRIVKGFVILKFEQLIQNPVTSLMIKMECISPGFTESLGSAFEGCSGISARIASFEADLLSPTRSILPGIIKALMESFLDGATKRDAAKAIREADERADQIVQVAFTSAAALNVTLMQLLIDLKASHPLLLGNARSLQKNDGPLIDALGTASETLQAFLKLLRSFSVNINEAKKVLAT